MNRITSNYFVYQILLCPLELRFLKRKAGSVLILSGFQKTTCFNCFCDSDLGESVPWLGEVEENVPLYETFDGGIESRIDSGNLTDSLNDLYCLGT